MATIPTAMLNNIPEGYTEEEVMDTITEVIRMFAGKFTFGTYDVEDISQEAWIFALNVLDKYDATRGASLRTFLVTHIRNRLISLKRDKWYRPEPKDISEEKREKWRERNSLKRNIAQPFAMESNYENTDKFNFVDHIQRSEIFDIIDRELPVEFRRDFISFLDGVTVPKPRRDKLIDKIKEILNHDEEG
jgi:RNA polymerase sigma factor (sigma-70 family)